MYTEKRGWWFHNNWSRRKAYELAGRLTEPDEAIRFAVFWSFKTSYNNPPDGLLVGTSRRVVVIDLTVERHGFTAQVCREYPADAAIQLQRRRFSSGAWATIEEGGTPMLLWRHNEISDPLSQAPGG